MFRRPKVQFKPKIQTISDRKKPQPIKSVPESPAIPGAACDQPPEKGTIAETCDTQVCDTHVALFGVEAVTHNEYELENVNSSNVPLNCLSEGSFESNDSLTTHEVLIETSDVFAVPQPVQPLSQPDVRSLAVVLETRKAVTLKAKETAAALTVTVIGDGSAHQSDARDKKQPRKPKICLSSNRIRLPIDKSKVTMFDLLSYNPPMSDEQKERRRKAEEEAEQLSQRSSSGSPSKHSIARSCVSLSPDSPAKDDQQKGASTGPRVKIAANGEIVIDEESLILTKKVEAVTDTVYEGSDQADSQVTYASFRNKNNYLCRKSRWTDEETVKFYKALSAVGTDFSLMSKVFFKGSRNRLDLRNKYKKEEKMNQHLIDKALDSTDLSLLDEIDLQNVGPDGENQEDQNLQPVVSPGGPVVLPEADANNNSASTESVSPASKRRRSRNSEEQEDEAPNKKKRAASKSADNPESTALLISPRRSLRQRK